MRCLVSTRANHWRREWALLAPNESKRFANLAFWLLAGTVLLLAGIAVLGWGSAQQLAWFNLIASGLPALGLGWAWVDFWAHWRYAAAAAVPADEWARLQESFLLERAVPEASAPRARARL